MGQMKVLGGLEGIEAVEMVSPEMVRPHATVVGKMVVIHLTRRNRVGNSGLI